jgi:alpha-galactosidase
MKILPAFLVFLLCVELMLVPGTMAVVPSTDELEDARKWVGARFEGKADTRTNAPLAEDTQSKLFRGVVPFSFVFDGRPSSELLKEWRLERSVRELVDAGPSAQEPAHGKTEYTLTWTDPASGLQLRCVVVRYHDFPTVEWTLYFKNTGPKTTSIVEKIQALDMEMDRGAKGEFLLHHNVGAPADGSDYAPLETSLPPNVTKRLGVSNNGRPTSAEWSYFNLEALGQGLVVAVGWPGQWVAELARDSERTVHIRAGQELTHFKLLPGEKVRSPLIVVQFWKGGWIRSQNIWRRWMLAHSVPRPGGKQPPPQLVASSLRQFECMVKANESNQVMFIKRYREEGIKLDYWWMDAGWCVNYGGGWSRVGTWEVDAARFPHGLRAVSDYAHSNGVKTLVWFEPERVTADTWLTRKHPEWVLGGAKGGLLDLGNDEARAWLTEHIDRLLAGQGIDLYRQDFNMDPLSFWRKNDAPDRQGITEIKHVTGYLAYWDELRRRHPKMLIDSCASGGRRNDLETMRRAVPLWLSDYAFEAVVHQSMTYGISLWLPYFGTFTVADRDAPFFGGGFTTVDPYNFWSNATPSLGLGIDVRVEEIDYAALRRLIAQWRQINPNYFGDFYPLTPYSRDDKAWIAWQFDWPEKGQGFVQAFRRHKSDFEAVRLKLTALNHEARYRVTDLDGTQSKEMSGHELVEKGLPISLMEQPAAAVLVYERISESR